MLFLVLFLAITAFTLVGMVLIGLPILILWAGFMVWLILDILRTVKRF